MKRCLVSVLFAILLNIGLTARAQSKDDAQWIWFDEGDPEKSTPAGKVWFHREVRANQPSTGAVRLICDDHFVLWVNGKKVGQGGSEKLYRFNLNGFIGRGPNVIAIEATNKNSKAGLFVDGEVRGQGGGSIGFDSGPKWRATRVAPKDDTWKRPRFDATAWKPVKVIGRHGDSPWKSIALTETDLDRFAVADGFELKRIAEPDLVGSVVAITWGNRGRLIVSREKGPILSVIDENGDGTYDKAVQYSDQLTNCQGLCQVFDDLYAVGTGPQGTGIYRLPDRDHDDRADEVVHIYAHKGGMGEHGPHNVVFGPDGWLYHNMGNHAWVTAEPEPTTPVRGSYEGYLLTPKFEDARGHARGIPVPGGTIWRFTPDGNKWWCEAAGFRNAYDFALNSKGDLFTFDSDMEWDVGMPWYRPVRVNHCIPGAEFGWRSGAAKWPEVYFDSLPGTVNIGRGSPTGVIFYEHRQFPEKYRGSFLVCDWSMGRIIAVSLKPQGATYTGTFENLVTGNPLNVSDIEIDRDGSMVFSTGGRRTEGGIYRLTYSDGPSRTASAESVNDVLLLPQISSAWARELVTRVKQTAGNEWQEALSAVIDDGPPNQKIRALTLLSQFGPKPTSDRLIGATKDVDPAVRAFAVFLLGEHQGAEVEEALTKLLQDEQHPLVQRRVCEALIRSGISPPDGAELLELLSSDDRWVRFAARLLLERDPQLAVKQASILAHQETPIVTHGLLALFRALGDDFDADTALRVEWELLGGKRGPLSDERKLEVLRMIELTLARGARNNVLGDISQKLLNDFPTSNAAVDAETARILAFLQHRGAAAKIVRALETAETPAQQIHYVLTLRYLRVGWNANLKRRLLDWYETTRDWEGGNSMVPYIANIVGGSLHQFQPDERKQFLTTWQERPFAAGLLIRNSNPSQVDNYEEVIGAILNDTDDAGQCGREELVTLAIEALGRSAAADARLALRQLYETNPDRREQLARAVSQRPTAGDWSLLMRTLQFADPTTMQLCLGALGQIDRHPEQADEFRGVLLAGLKLRNQGGLVAVRLLERWTGSKHSAGQNVQAALTHYRKWYIDKFPEAPPAELPQDDVKNAKYTFQQLYALLEQSEKGRGGDPQRGRLVFTKANCIKCHRFLKEGETVGPDLTSLRRRFQRKEIIESLIYPSQVISDQYRMQTVVTLGGLVHNGMPIPGVGGENKLVLILQNATRLEIPKNDIEQISRSKVSVMPVGALKDLKPQEIIDLFAFLETSRFNELTPRDPRAENKSVSRSGNR